MSTYGLKKESLPDFVAALARFGEVHGPTVTDDGVPVFRAINTAAELQLDYRRTLLPPKKYLLPSTETLLAFSTGKGYRIPAVPDQTIILFGLHPCDLAGIAYLDRVFLGDEPDPHYKSRRERTVLVGVTCEQDEFCFCDASAFPSSVGGDIFMTDTPEGYHLAASSPRGAEILAGIPMLTSTSPLPPAATESTPLLEIIEKCTARGETFSDSPLWQEFADRCLSCGACSLCCPTCYCFDVREYGLLDGKSAERIREWDNCLFKVHGVVAGGYNFRQTRAERFQYRFSHKYLGFGPLRGVVSCVGCGRCREVCPVRIDLLELFQESP